MYLKINTPKRMIHLIIAMYNYGILYNFIFKGDYIYDFPINTF